MANPSNPSSHWPKVSLPAEIKDLLKTAPSVTEAGSQADLLELAVHDAGPDGWHRVQYGLPEGGMQEEARVCRLRNGIAVNYPEPYMRRRDPDCMVIGDNEATDKKRFAERFGTEFDPLRQETISWLSQQELAVFWFVAGKDNKGMPAMAICPANAGFFAMGLAMLQGIVPLEEVDEEFAPRAVILIAPPFRQTHFDGDQVVVHDRREGFHYLFSYNLYPGPSAKKGVYGMLLHLGELEGWVTAHCSTVQVVTPYDNHTIIMHEGASGSGKSEMLEHVHREDDGQLLLGENVVSGERRHLTLPRGCDLYPVTDDMALCYRTIPENERKLTLTDAEEAWFIRVNHIQNYGTDPHLEGLTVNPSKPLLFLNIDAVPGSRALIWEHIEDEPGKACPNPRVVVPRDIVPGIVHGDVTVDIRSFGVRTPACTATDPSYGIVGLFHVLPPALAWLWRLTAPRGHANPSITDSESQLTSEGVGSYWPFATGRKVEHANLLLHQVLATPDTLFVLIPNQHVGAWKVGFMPQWLSREYLARRGNSRFRPDQLEPSRCSLLGYTPRSLTIEGTTISHWFLQVETQPEVGTEGYDRGAEQLYEFFRSELKNFLEPDLAPIGQKIIQCCLDGGTVTDYERFSEPSSLAGGMCPVPD